MRLLHKKAVKDGANIVMVDWSERSLNFYINKVSANARVVGRELRKFITNLGLYLHKSFSSLDRYHLIGRYPVFFDTLTEQFSLKQPIRLAVRLLVLRAVSSFSKNREDWVE